MIGYFFLSKSIALAIVKLLPEKKIVVLLKGYKGRLKGTIKVNKTEHSVIDTGDEALLYAKVCVTYICSNRKDAIDTIIKNENPDLIILDDGLQDSSINKSKSIVAINGRRGFGNKLLLPSGPLRENISSTLKKNYIFLILGEDKTNISSQYNNSFFKADIISEIDGNNREIVAFSGIGDNESFFQTLENYRFNLIKKISFPDHYHFSESEIKTIVDDAAKDGHEIYTTAKDWVRIDHNLKDKIKQFPINLEIKDKEKFIEAIFN